MRSSARSVHSASGTELCPAGGRTWTFAIAAVLLLPGMFSPPDVSSKIVVPHCLHRRSDHCGRGNRSISMRISVRASAISLRQDQKPQRVEVCRYGGSAQSSIKTALSGDELHRVPVIRFSDETRRMIDLRYQPFEGATSRERTLTGTISRRDGSASQRRSSYEGRREVMINSEKQVMSIGGIIKIRWNARIPVLSSAIADARINIQVLGCRDVTVGFIRILGGSIRSEGGYDGSDETQTDSAEHSQAAPYEYVHADDGAEWSCAKRTDLPLGAGHDSMRLRLLTTRRMVASTHQGWLCTWSPVAVRSQTFVEDRAPHDRRYLHGRCADTDGWSLDALRRRCGED